MNPARPTRLGKPVNADQDHILGSEQAEMVLVEYGSYVSPSCRATYDIVQNLQDAFGDRMSYVFRHFPGTSASGREAAELAEYASATGGEFWPVHSALIKRGPALERGDFAEIAEQFGLPPREGEVDARRSATKKVEDDTTSARLGGVILTPTFFINGRRYEGAWDEQTLSEAMQGSAAHRIQTASLDFVRWGPSAGILLLLMVALAVGLTNSGIGSAFEAVWRTPFGVQWSNSSFRLPLLDWINLGLLTIFFLVVGLEIKPSLRSGASRRRAQRLCRLRRRSAE